MPAILDRCVAGLMKDPKFKPRDPKQSKQSAAYAVCTASLKKVDQNLNDTIEILKSYKEKN